MRRLLFAVGVSCAVVGGVGGVAATAAAQGPVMPGQIVGSGITYNLAPVGTSPPRVGQPAGEPINLPTDNPLMRRYDPKNPYAALEGTNFTRSQVIAPVEAEQSLLDKIKALVGLSKPRSFEPQTGYFPSLTRRNRERVQQRLWRRD